MLPFQNYYGYGNQSGDHGLLLLHQQQQHHSSSLLGGGVESTVMDINAMMMDAGCGGGGAGSSITSRSTAEKKSAAACKSHSEAERRRRERINGHLRTLRTLLPNTTKTDKASLLAEVVQQVRDLKKVVSEGCSSSGSGSEWEEGDNQLFIVPSEADELKLSYCGSEEYYDTEEGQLMIKIVMCCEDRADLLSDVNKAMRSTVRGGGRVVKAEMGTVGGRTKSEFVIQLAKMKDESRDKVEELMSRLNRALKCVVEKRDHALSTTSAGSSQVLLGSKRPRLAHPVY